jgi:malonyl-CoA O-methyltransferase
MREVARVLAPGGLLMFSSYGPDSLRSIHEAFAAHLPHAAPVPLVDMHDLGDMMMASGFEAPVIESDRLLLSYGGVPQMLQELRALGGNPRSDRHRGLPGTAQARAVMAHLAEQAAADGRYHLALEVVIGHGWRRSPAAPSARTIVTPPDWRLR